MHARMEPDSPQPEDSIPVRRQILSALAVLAFVALLGWIIHVRSGPPPVPAVDPVPPAGPA